MNRIFWHYRRIVRWLGQKGVICAFIGHDAFRVTWNNKHWFRMGRGGKGRKRKYIHTVHHSATYCNRCQRRLG